MKLIYVAKNKHALLTRSTYSLGVLVLLLSDELTQPLSSQTYFTFNDFYFMSCSSNTCKYVYHFPIRHILSFSVILPFLATLLNGVNPLRLSTPVRHHPPIKR